MHTSTATQDFGSIPGDLRLEELYDVIMENIEPDLTSKNIGTLDEKYKDETPEQKKARGLRYAEAFALFEQAFAAMTHAWEEGMGAYRQDALAISRKTDAERNSRRLDDIGGAINAA